MAARQAGCQARGQANAKISTLPATTPPSLVHVISHDSRETCWDASCCRGTTSNYRIGDRPKLCLGDTLQDGAAFRMPHWADDVGYASGAHFCSRFLSSGARTSLTVDKLLSEI